MRYITLFTLSFFFFTSVAFTQDDTNNHPTHRTCGTMNVYREYIKAHPEARTLEELNKSLAREIKIYNQFKKKKVYNIPTIFHIIHNDNEINGSGSNISCDRSSEQLKIMNDDFRRLNADASNTPSYFQGVATDTEINFCPVTKYPSGHPKAGQNLDEPGINRVSTADIPGINNTNTGYSENQIEQNIKPATFWNPNEVMNIWVVRLTNNLLGYAQFPGVGAANTDGAVMGYQYFGLTGGAFGLGRTTTHELGHFFGLYHIWGDDGGGCNGSDQINDTPNQAGSTSGCPNGIKTDGCSGTGTNGVMYQNYMDYSNDNCMNLFTKDQKTRMQSVLASENRRKTLDSFSATLCVPIANNDLCNNIPALDDNAGIANLISPKTGSYCTDVLNPKVTLRNFGANALTSVTINYGINNNTSNTFLWTGNLAPGLSTSVVLPNITIPTGQHTFDANTSNPNGTTDSEIANDAATPANIDITIVAAPTVTGDSICSSGMVNLTATGSGSGNLAWYDAASNGNIVNTGGTYSPNLNTTTTFYVEEQLAPVTTKGGPIDNTIGGGNNFNNDQWLIFDVVKTSILVSVKVYAQGAANRTIELLDQNDNVLETKTINIPNGEQRVQLNFPLPVGTNFTLRVNGTKNLYRNNDGVSFPYPIGNIATIKNSSAGEDFYYFFYDWELESDGCKSGRTAVKGSINLCTHLNELDNEQTRIFPNPTKNNINVLVNSLKNTQISVLNVLGEEIYTRQVKHLKTQIDLSTQTKGIYFIRVTTENSTSTKKILLSK